LLPVFARIWDDMLHHGSCQNVSEWRPGTENRLDVAGYDSAPQVTGISTTDIEFSVKVF
jgi:hypothetical protein